MAKITTTDKATGDQFAAAEYNTLKAAINDLHPTVEAFNAVLTFNRVKFMSAALAQSGAISYSLASSGHVDGMVIRHKILSDGNAISFPAGAFVYPSSPTFTSGNVYEIYFHYLGGDVVVQVPGASSGSTATDTAPTASSVVVNNTTPSTGSVLTSAYTYADADGDAESGTTFKWQSKASGAADSTLVDITGATTQSYTVVSADEGNQLRFAVLPANANAIGVWTYSAWTTAVAISDTSTPVASFTPADQSTDVAVDSNLVISLNEAIRNLDGTVVDDTNVAALVTLKQTDVNGAAIAFTATINADKTQITVNPDANLGAGITIYMAVNNFEDAAGNENTVAVSITFTTAAAATADSLPYFADALLYINGDYGTDFVYDGTTYKISEVVNRADNANNLVQTNDARRPTWDSTEKAIRLTPTTNLLATTDFVINNKNHTALALCKLVGTTSYGILFNNSANNAAMVARSGGIQYTTPGDQYNPIYSEVGIDKVLHGFTDNGTNKIISRGGTYGWKSKAATSTATNIGIGSVGHAAVTSSFEGWIYKIVIYNRALTSAEYTEVYNYLTAVQS